MLHKKWEKKIFSNVDVKQSENLFGFELMINQSI